MPAPPARTEICDTYPLPDNATARTGFGKMWDYVTTLLGASGTAADARTALEAPSRKEVQSQTFTAYTTGGSSTAYTLATTPALAALTTGEEFDVTFHTAAGATPTLARDGLTAKLLKYRDGTGAKAAVTSTQVPASWRSKVVYDGTDYIVREVPVTAFASSAENAAGTIEGKAVDPLGIREAFNCTGSAPVYACRAWVNFNGTGTVAIRASGNVTSITDNGEGDYTVNFTTALPDANYSAVINALPANAAFGASARAIWPVTYGTGSLRVRTASVDASALLNAEDESDVFAAIFR